MNISKRNNRKTGDCSGYLAIPAWLCRETGEEQQTESTNSVVQSLKLTIGELKSLDSISVQADSIVCLHIIGRYDQEAKAVLLKWVASLTEMNINVSILVNSEPLGDASPGFVNMLIDSLGGSSLISLSDSDIQFGVSRSRLAQYISCDDTNMAHRLSAIKSGEYVCVLVLIRGNDDLPFCEFEEIQAAIQASVGVNCYMSVGYIEEKLNTEQLYQVEIIGFINDDVPNAEHATFIQYLAV